MEAPVYSRSFSLPFFLMVVASFKIMVKGENDKINCEEILQKKTLYLF